MKNTLRNVVLIAAVLCPSFAMPSGTNKQLVKQLLGSGGLYAACVGGGLIGYAMLDDGDETVTIPSLCGFGIACIAFPVTFAFYTGKMLLGADYSSSTQLPVDTEKKDEDCKDTPFYYDYAPVAPFTRRSMVKPFIARCCVPTAISMLSFPFFKELTPFFSSAVFHVGLQSCLYEASMEDRESKKATFQQLEVSRRQSIRNSNRVAYKEAKEASHRHRSSIAKAFNEFLNQDVSADSLKALITFIEKESYHFSCNIRDEERDEEENNSFNNEDLEILWYEARKKVKEDLLSENSLFFNNISLLDDEAQQKLCNLYYSWTVEHAYPKNLFRSSEYCGERLEMLYKNQKNWFSGKFLTNTKWVMSDLIQENKFSMILGICILTENNVLCHTVRSGLLYAYTKLQNNSLDCDDKELDALKKLYNIFLNTDDTSSIIEKLAIFLNHSQQKSARK